MSLADFFEFLGAPLKNKRWSWGAVRKEDGAVFLRVWQDEVRKLNGARYVKVLGKEDEDGGTTSYYERAEHVELVRQGAICYFVMCQKVAVDAEPSQVKISKTHPSFRAESSKN